MLERWHKQKTCSLYSTVRASHVVVDVLPYLVPSFGTRSLPGQLDRVDLDRPLTQFREVAYFPATLFAALTTDGPAFLRRFQNVPKADAWAAMRFPGSAAVGHSMQGGLDFGGKFAAELGHSQRGPGFGSSELRPVIRGDDAYGAVMFNSRGGWRRDTKRDCGHRGGRNHSQGITLHVTSPCAFCATWYSRDL